MKPHDELFRMGHGTDLPACLPDLAGRIDMNTVTAVDATFTGGKQGDLLLSIRERSDGNRRGREHLVYMLVEHKSYHDPLVAVLVATPLCGGRCSHMRPVQLYRYLGAIWHQQWALRESSLRGPLPVIHPVVFYHGDTPWTAPLELTGLHGGGDADHVPDDDNSYVPQRH